MNTDDKSYLSIYIGIPENSADELLYLDLIIPHRRLVLWSSESINDSSGEDFLDYLSKALNEATIWAIALGIKIRVDTEMILQTAEEFNEQNSRNIHQLLKSIN